MEQQFINLCSNGDLLGAQQFLQLNQTINIFSLYESAFCSACSKGHLDVCQWLIEVSEEKGKYINISAYNEWAFCYACENGHLELAQWLFQISKERGQPINISADDEHAFRGACWFKQLSVAQWLQSLKPYLYVIIYDEKGNYKYYFINSKEEANWEKRKYLVYIASDCKEDNLLYRLPCDVSKMVIGYV